MSAAPPRSGLIRKHAVMTLKPGSREAYRASHNEGFWPEMGAMLKAHGAHNYAISLLEEPAGSGGGTLFAYVEIEDEARWAAVKDTEICKKVRVAGRGSAPSAERAPRKTADPRPARRPPPASSPPAQWWAWMKEFIVFNEDGTPKATPLTEMFFLA